MRSLFDDLARLLATPEGLRTARLLQAAGLLGNPPALEPRPLPRLPEPISIWQPQEIDGETVWVRPDPQPLGDHFAATRVLRRKKAELPLRVVLFGESAAAGYLYAPHVTPAQVLERHLHPLGELADQRGLADARRAPDEHRTDRGYVQEELRHLAGRERLDAIHARDDPMASPRDTHVATTRCVAGAPGHGVRERRIARLRARRSVELERQALAPSARSAKRSCST